MKYCNCSINYKSEENKLILKNKYNLYLIEHLSNNDYDEILKNNILFLDVYNTSANNIILEAILHSTPILVCKHEAIIEYLGIDYPFYFNSLEEANLKVNDFELINETSKYLMRLDKQKLLYSNFNREIENIIIEYFKTLKIKENQLTNKKDDLTIKRRI